VQFRIAVVEDDQIVRSTVIDVLETAGFIAVPCSTAEALLALMRSGQPPHLILLDLQLPDQDGIALASAIRASSDVPIVMLTGRSGEIDRIVGLEIGADDYVVKPFSNLELLARVKAILRRVRGIIPASRQRHGFRFEGFFLDLSARRLEAPDGSSVQLTVAEFDLLHALLRARGRVLTRDQLLDMTHHAEADVFDRTIDVLILRLRRKIEPVPSQPRFIRTERGLGYMFTGTVEEAAG
jgi:two-component system OmpR family response regulator